MLLAATLLAVVASGQPPLRLAPLAPKDVFAAEADAYRCIARQAQRIERLEENLESVARLALVECDVDVSALVHAKGGASAAELSGRLSQFQRQAGDVSGKPGGELRAPDMSGFATTVSVTQTLTRMATSDAIAAREARLRAPKADLAGPRD